MLMCKIQTRTASRKPASDDINEQNMNCQYVTHLTHNSIQIQEKSIVMNQFLGRDLGAVHKSSQTRQEIQ